MKRLINLLQIGVAVALIACFLFYRLGSWPFRTWDEARLITSAYEMLANHKYLTPTIDGYVDMWNTKPPLMIWAEALCIKVFGFCEWSVRLPAAISGAFTIIMVAFFVKKLTKDRWVWLITVVVLCTSGGLIGFHAARFAEYDAMLTLFSTAALLAFFAYTENVGQNRSRYLVLFFAALTLACLTKGIAVLLFAPALFVYLLFSKQLLSTLTNKYFYFGAIGFIFFVAGYYALREHINPGYISAVWENELGGRFNAVVDTGQETPASAYIQEIRGGQFSTWIWALYTSLISIWILSKGKMFRAAIFCWVAAAGFLIFISISKTKHEWYDLPVFPLFAVIVSIVLFQMTEFAERLPFINRQIAAVILILIFSIQPIEETFSFIRYQGDNLAQDPFYAPSYYFRDALHGKRDLNGSIYLSCGYNIQWRLYIKMLNDKGIDVKDHCCIYGGNFNAGDNILANQAEMKDYIEKNYNFKVTDEFYGLKNYLIVSTK
jgi:4-amino-4-deoxy-L-arabinose transferase-like glycosyltransferase